MQLSKILTEIDLEISRLEQAKALLAGESSTTKTRSKTISTDLSAGRKKKRNLSPEGRKRIAEAVRRRWELQKKASAK